MKIAVAFLNKKKKNKLERIINNNILIDHNLIENEFDKVLGKNTYNKVCDKLIQIKIKKKIIKKKYLLKILLEI